jgi:protein-disulfide isomerase
MKFFAPLALAAALATPALATDLEALSDAERDAFRAEVRAYLLENPEVLMEAIAVLEERQANADVERDQMVVAANEDAIFNSAFDWIGGNPEGDVTIVEFFDYRCGYCRRVHPEVEALIEGDGNIRYIAKEFPILGEQSLLASRFAIATRVALGDDAYEAISNGLITMRGDMTDASLTALAVENGLDPVAITAAMSDPLVDATISYNHELASRMNITGTPTFVFGDQLVRGAIGIDDMQRIIEMVRADAD